MSKYISAFKELEEAVELLLKREKHWAKVNKELQEEVKTLQLELTKLSTHKREVENKNKQLKVARALDGDLEHRRVMKFKLNQLIKEVDKCITEVKQSSI